MAPATEPTTNSSQEENTNSNNGSDVGKGNTSQLNGASTGSNEEGNKFDADNFLSSLRDGIREDVHGKSTGLPEPQAMGRVKDLHGKLKTVVANLSDKVSIVLQKQENEFLAAYRAHMYNVQKELQELRAKVDDTELKMKKDSKISKLEEERDWYRKEALRLDSFATTMKKEMKYMKDKLESIEEDRSWLEKQLKTCKKQNKLLCAELEITMNGSQLRDGSEQETEKVGKKSSLTGDSSTVTPSLLDDVSTTEKASRDQSAKVAPMKPDGIESPTESRMVAQTDSKTIEAGMDAPVSQLLSSQDCILPMTGSQVRDKRVREQIRTLREQLDTAQKTVQQLRANAVDRETNESELEGFFLQCIQDVKKDIIRRRTKSMQGIPKARAALEVARQHQGISLAKFTATDRRRVLDSLLSNGTVLGYIYDSLFPPTGAKDGQGGPPGTKRQSSHRSGSRGHHRNNSSHKHRSGKKLQSEEEQKTLDEMGKASNNDGKRPDSPVEDHVPTSPKLGASMSSTTITSPKQPRAAAGNHASTGALPVLSSP